MSQQIDTRGFSLHGESGNWTATSSDVEGWGRTRKAAIEAALKERRGNREDGEQMDREAGVKRDEFGFEIHGESCDCADGPDADETGTCRVCGGHD